MSTACFPPLVVILALSRCTLRCLDSSKIFSSIFLLARYELSRHTGFKINFQIQQVGVDGSLSLEVKVDQHFEKLKVVFCG